MLYNVETPLSVEVLCSILISFQSFVEDYHRKSHNKEVDEAAVLRVPIALAIVKLLQQLPKATLHGQLPG